MAAEERGCDGIETVWVVRSRWTFTGPGNAFAKKREANDEGVRFQMKMHVVLAVGVAMAVAAATVYAAEHPGAAKAAVEKKAVVQKVYVCPDCETMALKEGKCEKCGKEMVEKHVLGTKEGKAMICDCAAGCTCDAKSMKEGKCACGKEVKTMSCKGMYVCPMGCAELSMKAGKCKVCGMEMTKVE
jgi:hypothetical protein